MLAIVAIGLVILIVAFLAFVGSRPSTIKVERRTSVKAPAEKIFPLINDFHSWIAWSPYEKFDPAMKKTYSGAASGIGAIYEWEGNNKVGKGRMEMTEAVAPRKIVLKLDFEKPFQGHNISEFAMEPRGDSTTLTWAMRGPANFVMKAMGVFMNMDHMIGKDFESGLANLKAIAEK